MSSTTCILGSLHDLWGSGVHRVHILWCGMLALWTLGFISSVYLMRRNRLFLRAWGPSIKSTFLQMNQFPHVAISLFITLVMFFFWFMTFEKTSNSFFFKFQESQQKQLVVFKLRELYIYFKEIFLSPPTHYRPILWTASFIFSLNIVHEHLLPIC